LLTPVILATWEATIGRIVAQGQPRQIVHEFHPPSPKNKQRKMDWRCGSSGRVPAEVEGLVYLFRSIGRPTF
jgi:hypothetical protein